jgi:hypothetical protein
MRAHQQHVLVALEALQRLARRKGLVGLVHHHQPVLAPTAMTMRSITASSNRLAVGLLG